ncbi:TRAP transporter small permease subunit [Rhodobacterales bacterium HKCCE3408]|nr:TRAP transporter small permease subunit [Rhodobacterales bacterium HKCCE3408]
MTCAVAGSVGTLGIMALINADVVGRGLFGTPMPATAEIVSAAIVSIVFLQLPHATLMGRNIRSDMLIGRLERGRPRAALALDTFHHILGTLMLAIMLYFVAPELVTAVERNETVGLYGVLLLPSWPFVLMVVIGLALSLVAYALISLGYLTALLSGRAEP